MKPAAVLNFKKPPTPAKPIVARFEGARAPLPTRARDADWANVGLSAVVSSHRATTSSRKPGAVFTGNVRHERNTLNRCPNCGGFRLLLSAGPHAPHWVSHGSALTLVDCVGKEITE